MVKFLKFYIKSSLGENSSILYKKILWLKIPQFYIKNPLVEKHQILYKKNYKRIAPYPLPLFSPPTTNLNDSLSKSKKSREKFYFFPLDFYIKSMIICACWCGTYGGTHAVCYGV